jgi:hypothetical protein
MAGHLKVDILTAGHLKVDILIAGNLKVDIVAAGHVEVNKKSPFKQKEKKRLGLNFDNDGEFYMTIDDLAKNFDTVDLCHLPNGHIDDSNLVWHESNAHGQWIKGFLSPYISINDTNFQVYCKA